MAAWCRNKEGYADNTAGMAIQRITKEEKAVAKKRSGRRTADENKIHEKAVKMRRMTDEQLVHYVEDRVEKARSEGFHQGRRQAPEHKPAETEKILAEIGSVRGIGTSKLHSIRTILKRHLEARPDMAGGEGR